MRVVTVLSIMTIGAGLGSAAVLLPLTSQPSQSDWLVNWNMPAIRQMVAMLPDKAGLSSAPASTKVSKAAAGVADAATPTVRIATAGLNQDQRTFDVLTQHSSAGDTAGSHVEIQPWKTTTTTASEALPRAGRPTSKPANDDQRYQLVRAIQVELARVGCYSGGTDGQWSAATRRAMGQFNDRLNATLPYDEPDLILLTLVKGHRGVACSGSCPSGQQLTDGGQCQPSSIVAHADRPKSARRLKPEQQPNVVATAPVQKQPEPSFGTTTVTAAAEPALPTDPARMPPDSNAVTVRSASPLPGRMAMGGPVPAALPEDHQPVTAALDDDQPSPPPSGSAVREKKPQPATTQPRRASAPVVIKRAPAPYRAPQVSAAQPKKQKWHPNNPFWQSF